jgi:ArsR family transcriptional regulator
MSAADIAPDIEACQYRRVTKSLPLLTDPIACCAPLAREPLSEEQATDLARVLKALADPGRLRLLSLVLSHEGGEACVCDLQPVVELSQPTVSHHLKVLHEAGLLDREKRGVWVYYRARTESLAALAALLGGPIS